MTELTRAQQRILDFIQAELHTGRPIPTLREIADRFGFRSHRAALQLAIETTYWTYVNA